MRRYAKESKVLFKVAGYADSVKQSAAANAVHTPGSDVAQMPTGMTLHVHI